MFASLRSRLLLLLLLIAIPAFGLTLNAYLTIDRQGMARIERDAHELVQLAAKDQQTVTAEARLLLNMLAQMSVMRDPQQADACHQMLANLLRQQPGYINLGAADRDGNFYCSAVPASAPLNVSDRNWFQKAAASNDFVISDYQIGLITGKPRLAFGYPLRGLDGEFQGALFAASDLSWLQRLVSAAQLPKNSTAVVIDPNGRILARFPDPGSWVGKTLPDTPLAQLVRTRPGPGFTELLGIDGVQRFYAYTPLASADSGVYLLIGLSHEAALDSLRQTLTSLILLGLLTLLGLVATWWGANALLTRPLARLAEAARQLGAGDFSAGRCLTLGKSAKELDGLATCFNDMATALAQQSAAREAVMERFQRLLDATPLPLCSASLTGDLRYINHRFTETFGYTLADVPTMDDWWQLAYPDPDYRQQVIAAWGAAVANAAQTGTDIEPTVYQITGKNGQTRLIEVSGVLLGDELLAMFLDVTERRLAESALRQREQEFKKLLDATPLPLCSISQDGALHYINDRFIKMFGYTLAEVPTLDDWWRAVCPDPDYRQWAATTWERTVRYHRWAAATWEPNPDDTVQLGVDLAPFEYQIVAKNGQIRQLEISGVLLGDEALALFMDVTERRQAESALRQREQEYKTLAEHSPDLIARFDRQLRHLYVSPLIRAMTGREPAEFIGKTNRELGFNPALVDQWEAAIQQVFATGHEQQIEFSLPGPDGTVQHFESRLAPEFGPTGAVDSVLGVTRNMTTRNRAAAEREALQQQLIDASRLAGMTEVATGVLHNVGNVLNSVNVSVQLINDNLRASRVANLTKTVHLLRENQPANQPDYAERNQRLLDYLAALADHLQDEQEQLYGEAQAVAEKIEHIKRIVSRQQAYTTSRGVNEPIVLTQLIDDALAMNIADHHVIAIIREYQPLPLQLLDKHKLLQIVANLVRNAKEALKEQHSANRRLIVRLHRGGRGLQIEIADNGIGIAPEHLSRVFEFGFTTKAEGHGFGLHISANLARELGGELSCYSAGLGQGAVFTLDLPGRALNADGLSAE
ncbi:MAG: PAS domain S-box protein [Candidatus Contendobacter sp.]|jgi:PAS domain S-box-containing protein|nr:PAS domain S-box protein [Gammaproteobacteria bacterium]MCC8993978.1 PAS domain S-box protein [Candidatus Contendobacter sp.]